MALEQSLFALDRRLQVEVRIHGLVLGAGLGVDDGNVTSIEVSVGFPQPIPMCTISFPRLPLWVRRDQTVEIDAGYDGELTRVFTGQVKKARHTDQGDTVDCMGRTQLLTQAYRTTPKSFTNTLADAAIVSILDDVDFTNYDLDDNLTDWTLGTVKAADVDGSPLEMIQKIADVDGNRVFEARTGIFRVRQLLEAPAPTSAFRYTIGAGENRDTDTTHEYPVSNIDSAVKLGDATARSKRGQGIIPNASGVGLSVRFSVRRVGSPLDFVRFSVYRDNGSGLPSSLLGSSGQYNGQLFGTVAYTDLTLALIAKPQLTDGTLYHVVIERTGAPDAVNYYEVGIDSTGTFSDGAASVFNGSAWSTVAGSDHPVALTVRSYGSARILAISDDEDPDQVKKEIIVLGATLESTDSEGNQTQTQIKGDALTTSTLLLSVDPSLASLEYQNALIQDDTKAGQVALRLLDKYHRVIKTISLSVPFNPLLDLGQTLGIDDRTITRLSGNWWINAYKHTLSASSAETSIDLFGGDQSGTPGIVKPTAELTYKAERELIGTSIETIITYDGSASHAFDGQIVTYHFTDDYSPSPMNVSGPSNKVTRAYDPVMATTVNVTLEVTGDNGLSNSVTIAVSVDANSNTEIYTPVVAAAAGNTCMQSQDGARTWVDKATPSGLAKVTAITYDPTDLTSPFVFLFGTDDGNIFRSIDNLASLTAVYTDADADALTSIVPDVYERSVVWATTTDRVLKSTDFGATWSVYADFNTQLVNPPLGFEFLTPQDPRPLKGLLVASPSVHRIWIYGGRGDVPETWFNTNYLPDGPLLWHAEIRSGDGPGAAPRVTTESVVAVAVSNGGSGDLALMFADSAGSPTDPYVYSALFYPAGSANWQVGGGAFTAAGKDGVGVASNNLQSQQFGAMLDDTNFYVSQDGVNFWPIPAVLPGTGANRPHHLLNLNAWQDIYFAATDEGIAKTVDGGITWQFLRPQSAPWSTTWPAGAVGWQTYIEYRKSPQQAFKLALLVTGGGEDALALRSGGDWLDAGPLAGGAITTPHRLWHDHVYDPALFFYDPGTAISAGDEAIYRSPDTGATWTRPSAPANVSQQAFAFGPDGTLWLAANAVSPAAQGNGIFRSTDGGATWVLVHTGADTNTDSWHIAVDPLNPNRVAVAGERGAGAAAVPMILITSENALDPTPTFTSIDTGLTQSEQVSPKVVAGQNGRWIIAFPNGGSEFIYTTDDDGATWIQRMTRTGHPVHLLRAGNILFHVSSAGVMQSTDNGQTWQALPAINFGLVTGGAWDPETNILFVITNQAGDDRIQYMLNPAVDGVWHGGVVGNLDTALGYTATPLEGGLVIYG